MRDIAVGALIVLVVFGLIVGVQMGEIKKGINAEAQKAEVDAARYGAVFGDPNEALQKMDVDAGRCPTRFDRGWVKNNVVLAKDGSRGDLVCQKSATWWQKLWGDWTIVQYPY